MTPETTTTTIKPLYYTNPRPSSGISKNSASKRSSIQALTSIQYLQHSFAKIGLEQQLHQQQQGLGNLNWIGRNQTESLMEEPEEMDRDKENDKMKSIGSGSSSIKSRKAINRGLRINNDNNNNNNTSSFQLNLPPTPTKPSIIRKLPWELKGNNKLSERKNLLSKKEIRINLVNALNLLIEKWGLINHNVLMKRSEGERAGGRKESSTYSNYSEISDRSLNDHSMLQSDGEEIGSKLNFLDDLFTSTTKAVRIIQHASISLPPTSLSLLTSTSTSSSSSKDPFSTSTSTTTTTTTTTILLRQSSLLVLGTLQNLKDLYRISPSDSTLSPQDQNQQATSSMLKGSGRATSTYDFSDDDDDASSSSSDEFLNRKDGIRSEVVQYRDDIELEDLRTEIEIIREYVEIVDRSLLRRVEGSTGAGVGVGEIKLSGGAFGLGEVEVEEGKDGKEESSLPIWAREGEFETDIDRIHSILSSHLHQPDLNHLISPSLSGTTAFLESILDGTLLCLAYNSVLLNSSRPFGFIPMESIHRLNSFTTSSPPPLTSLSTSTSSLSKGSPTLDKGLDKDKKIGIGSTFRKVENLRMFVAALKFRYQVHLPPSISFDAKFIIRKEIGWEKMLEVMLRCWMDVVIEEKRGEEGEEL